MKTKIQKTKDQERTEQAVEWQMCARDPVYFIDTYVKIRHPTDGIVPFSLWPWQIQLVQLIHKENKVIVLKSRQLGVSEIAVAYALWLIRFHAAKTVLFLSKNEDDAKELLKRAKLSYEHLPPFLQCGAESIDTTVIKDDNTSRFQIDHLDSKKHPHPSAIRSLPATQGAGRSASASLVILDEWAHQQWADDIWTAVQPTVASGGKLLGISTANGVGNTFHHIWADSKAGRNDFKTVFLPWNRHPKRDEKWYKQTEGDLGQPWRMAQEHPTTAIEAFVQSGRPVFGQEALSRHEERIRADNIQSITTVDIPFALADGITIWETPQVGHEYIIGADVAEGLEHGDYDAAVVTDRANHREVAELHGHWNVEHYAQKLDWIAHYYNKALLAVERNNHGHSVILALNNGIAHEYNGNMRLPYPHIYRHEDPFKKRGEIMDMKDGWPTTTVTRPLMIDALGKALRDNTFQCVSLAFLDECLTFAIQPNGKMESPAPYHDDRIMARAIAVYLLTQPTRMTRAQSFIDQYAEIVARDVQSEQIKSFNQTLANRTIL